jgi:large subunit ribosomal protein L11
MAKKILKQLKLQVPAGKAIPAPPLGPSLGQAGINISEFINRFNTDTQSRMGEIVPTIVTVYEDRTFDMVYKKPPASFLVMKAAGIKGGSGTNTQKKAGSITKAQLREIAEYKMEDLSANDVEAAMKIMEGSARSMGVEIK